jgi:glycosyltransferase involved in cell wall biosynthesis
MTDRDGLRVVHLVPALFGPAGVVGGAERYGLELARAMAHEIDVDLVTFGEQPLTEHDGRFTLHVLGNPRYVRGQRSNPVSLRLFPALRPAAIVHCHQQHVLASSLAALYCRATGRRVFVTDLGGGGWDISGYLSTDSWYHGHLHLSEYSRKVLGHAGNPRARVILGGVDTERFAPQAGVARSQDEVVFVGRILPHKGINDLIEALPPGMRLRVIGREGDPRYRQDLERLAAGKTVTFQRDVEDAALVAAYRQALCVVLPSVYRTMYGQETSVPELLGQTLLEGMACGAPTIATSVASLPEVVEDGVTGFLVPPNDPTALRARLEWLRTHPDRATEMGAAGRRRVQQHFTWPAVVRRCLAAYGDG